jgi:hypothetical protein
VGSVFRCVYGLGVVSYLFSFRFVCDFLACSIICVISGVWRCGREVLRRKDRLRVGGEVEARRWNKVGALWARVEDPAILDDVRYRFFLEGEEKQPLAVTQDIDAWMLSYTFGYCCSQPYLRLLDLILKINSKMTL